MFGRGVFSPYASRAFSEESQPPNDSTHDKEAGLVGMGWMPSEYQEGDLSVKTGKIKKTRRSLRNRWRSMLLKPRPHPFVMIARVI